MEQPPSQRMDNGSPGRLGSDPTPLGSDPGSSAFCLNMHAQYRCRHAGACCTAGWAIPVETLPYQTLRVHFGRPEALFQERGALPDGVAAILGVGPAGECVFFDAEHGRLCAIHRELGESFLPAACRQFPRVVVHDTRGVLISLSHYCPTAASMLLSSPALEIVPAPASLALHGRAEGLDARESLPPLLRPGMLTDPEGYDAWERRALATLARPDLDADGAIGRIAAATRQIRTWRPGGGSLRAAVEHEFDVASAAEPDEDLDADIARGRLALASVPAGLVGASLYDTCPAGWADVSRWWPELDAVARRYLAARLFGNWIAYHGQGLHAVVEYLRVSLAVLKLEAARQQSHLPPGSASRPWQTLIEAVRNADLLLVHLSDPKELARRLS